MSDAADELAEALQPAGLLQPPLEALLFGGGPQPLALGLHRQPLGDVPDRRDDQLSRCSVGSQLSLTSPGNVLPSWRSPNALISAASRPRPRGSAK